MKRDQECGDWLVVVTYDDTLHNPGHGLAAASHAPATTTGERAALGYKSPHKLTLWVQIYDSIGLLSSLKAEN